jgi:hypothetical protein
MVFKRPSIFRPARPGAGFTLIDTALATIIVGLGVVSLCDLMAKGTVSNINAAQLTTGANLARNIREMSLELAFQDPNTPSQWGLDSGETAGNPSSWNDINDLDALTISPPIDSQRNTISTLSGWSQSIVVHSVDQNHLSSDVPDGSSPAVRVTVTIAHDGAPVTTLTWFAFNGTP